jgi:hypothetical protein
MLMTKPGGQDRLVADKADFQQKQLAFAAHIRDPQNAPAPDEIEDRRMDIYRQLFFNNLLSLLSSTFPVLTKLHSKEKWRSIIRQFMVRHEAQTPYFLEIPKEFMAFLEEEYQPGDDDFPFLRELAHYEWVELALSVSEESNNRADIDVDGEFLDNVPVKSALAWNLSYQFPVHQIDANFQPTEPGDTPTCLAIFRKADDELGFMALNTVTARLLQLIEDNTERNTGRELLLRLADELNYTDPDAMLAHGVAAMQEMRDSEILIGVAK